MGAASIVGGTLFAVIVRGEKPPLVEWLLLVLISALFCYRLIRLVTSSS